MLFTSSLFFVLVQSFKLPLLSRSYTRRTESPSLSASLVPLNYTRGSNMMYTFIIGLLAVSVCVSAQSSCRPDPEVPNTSGIPTLYYKPFVPPQIAPTSTVWAHVVYETFFVSSVPVIWYPTVTDVCRLLIVDMLL